MDMIIAHATKNLCYVANQKMTPSGIVVHSTGANNPNLKRYVDAVDEVGINRYGNHWNTATPGGRKVCVHAFIGYDKNNEVRVAQILPFDICCWGVGSGSKGSYNYDPAYIQFEICEDNLADRAYYEKAFGVAAEFCARLCRTYNIDIDNIVGHCEAYRRGYGSNHSDPEHWMKKFGETMDDFRKRVSQLLECVESPLTDDIVYSVQTGIFCTKADADAVVEILKTAGVNGFVVSHDLIRSQKTDNDDKEVVEEAVPIKSIDDLAKEVINGKWGNGGDRKKRLTEAGYDFSAVQARVNEMLR